MEKNKKKETLNKVPKGTQDFAPARQSLRQKLIDIATNQFKLFGAKAIDTPIFEREDVLMEKYGEESDKEIFRLVTEGSSDEAESLALRYDLTVPFARYVKTKRLKKIKRYQVGKVYRRDQPNMKAGRYREFLQCDYDCLDEKCDPNLADAETLTLLVKILDKINLEYTIRLNDRDILCSLLEYCGVPSELYGTVCSSIDKLDKKKWKLLVPELESKGLRTDVIEKIGTVLDQLKCVSWDSLVDIAFIPARCLTRFRELYRYLTLMDKYCIPRIRIDFTLARGLDYYTGIIFEATLKKKRIGSIAGGGRYDRLCEVPCVGFSVGIDRIIASLRSSILRRDYNPTVWIIQVNPNDMSPESLERLFEYRIQVLSKIRKYGRISVGTELRSETGMGAQMKYVLKNEIPYIIFVGPDEINNNTLTLKDMDKKKEMINLSLSEVVQYINDQNDKR